MNRGKHVLALVAGAAIVGGGVFAASGAAWQSNGLSLTNVPTANTKSDGYSPASKLSPELAQIVLAQGSTRLENPSSLTSYYGYDNDVLNAAGQPQMVPTPTTPTEAQKTEPDKNTYLVFRSGLNGADPNYDYGTHFLYQGHEVGANDQSYITRINLDADAAHRVTLLATTDSGGTRSPELTAPPGTRGPSVCCSPPRTPERPPTRPRRTTPRPSTTSRARWGGAATKASSSTRRARSGSSRTPEARSRTGPPPSDRTASCSATCRQSPVIWRTASSRRCRS